METLTLESDIIDLVCRTCLKNSEIKFNIFQDFRKNKLISDLIMKCTPIKLQKDDGYPVNICNNCIDNLTSTCSFIAMVVESDVKLKFFYMNNVRCQTTPNNDSKNIPTIKNEDNGIPHNSINFSGTEKSNLITTCEDKYSSCGERKSSNLLDWQNVPNEKENVIEPDYSSDIEEKSMVLTCEISDESSEAFSKDQTDSDTNNFRINSDNHIAQEDVNNTKEKCDKIGKQQSHKECGGDFSNVIMKCEEGLSEISRSTEKVSPHKLLGRIKPCDQCNSDSKIKINQPKKSKPCRKKNIKLFAKTNINMKHAELVDNPDVKRIMSMNLSKTEQNRQTIFCKECNKTLTFAYFLDTHIHLHTGNLPFKCDKCGKAYPNRSIFNKHRRRHEAPKKIPCEECGKPFISIHALKQHRLVHSNEKPYRCDICGKALKYAPSLSSHMKIHKNEKNHVCEICGKAFVDYQILQVHIMRHTVSEKNFECKICGKRYALKKDLDKHVVIHSNIKPHVCNQCGKSFLLKDVLKKHQLIHTGEKPHTCNVCGKRFRQSSCISRHMRVHTGETPYACDLCNSTFKYKHHLQNHMKVHQK